MQGLHAMKKEDYVELFKQLDMQGKAIIVLDVSEMSTLIVATQWACAQAAARPSSTLDQAERIVRLLQEAVGEKNPYLARVLDEGWRTCPQLFEAKTQGNGQ